MRAKPLLLCAPVLAGALLWLSGCGDNSSAAAPEKKKDDKAQPRRYPVTTTKASVRPLQYEIETTGSLQAEDIFRVDAQVPGVIQDVDFKEGDQVTEQKVLCRVSPVSYALAAQRAKDAWQKAKDASRKATDDLEDMKRQTRNQVERLQLRLAQAERDVARRQPAFEARAVSEDEYLLVIDRRDAALIELKDAKEAAVTVVKSSQSLAAQRESEAKQAETEWKQAEEDLRKSSVVVPIAGTIDTRHTANGAHVSAGTPLAQVIGKGLKLKFTLPEQESAHVAAGTALVFRVMAHPGRDFNARIYYLSNLADAKTRQVTCWAKVEPTDAVLKSGFFATVKIVTQDKKSAVVIPITAAQPTEYGFVVYVVESGKQEEGAPGGPPPLRAQRRKVTLGLQVADKAVEVVDGLKEGEVIVVEGGNALSDGVLVKEGPPASDKKDAAAKAPKDGQ